MGTLCQQIRLAISALWRSTFLRGSVSSHSEHFQLIALSALALFAVLVAGLASDPGCTAGFAACCPADSAAGCAAECTVPASLRCFFFFRRLWVDNRGFAAEEPTLADRSARAPSPC